MRWWSTVANVIAAQGIDVAVAGGVAANAYMPPRQTADLDLAVRIADLSRTGDALRSAGWVSLGPLDLYEDLRGTAWELDDQVLDVVGLPGTWGEEALSTAQDNRQAGGLPTLTLPWVVLTKLISARLQDSADISRMLGPASAHELSEVRAVVERWRPADLADLDQIIVAGQLEFGPARH